MVIQESLHNIMMIVCVVLLVGTVTVKDEYGAVVVVLMLILFA